MRVLRALSSLLVTVTLIGCTSQSTAPGPAVLRDTAPPWPAPRDGLAQIQAAGLEPSRLDDTSGQRRFTLTIAIDGTPVALVPYIGMDRPRAPQGARRGRGGGEGAGKGFGFFRGHCFGSVFGAGEPPPGEKAPQGRRLADHPRVVRPARIQTGARACP